MRERKYRKLRKPHKVFLVVCEGETEESYVDALRQHYRLPVTIKTKVSGNAISLRLVNQYVKELGLGREDDCCIFYIYDADVECVTKKLKLLPGTVIQSNPSIELWYLLHSNDCQRHVSSDAVVKLLTNSHPLWKNYGKGYLSPEQKKYLIDQYSAAASRTKVLQWPKNPSSNMYAFVEALEAEKY